MAGIIAGSVFAFIMIVILACYCFRRRQQAQMQEEMRIQNLNNPNHQMDNTTTIVMPGYGQPAQQINQSYNQPYGQPHGQPYNQPNIQPNIINPVYGQPTPAYLGSQNHPTYGQPVYN
jgi:hypothetical protein